MTERIALLKGEGFVWRLEVQVPVAGLPGPCVRLGVLVGVGVSLGTSAGEDSFVVCWTRTYIS